MIDKQQVRNLVTQWLETKEGYFLVDSSVTTDNRVLVEIDHAEGVWIDDCVELSRFIESNLDRDIEDYELEVGSAGIGQPFKVLQQYINHIGSEVEVMTDDGKRLKGVLLSANAMEFTIQTKERQRVEGAKRPKMVDVELSFRYDEVKYTKYIISLK